MNQIITCPFCSEQYSISPEQETAYVGQRVPCGKCNGVFMVVRSGAALQAIAPAGPAVAGYAVPTPQASNGIALAGLICGIVGFFTCGLAGIAGIICSAIGLSRAKATGKGQGIATAGLIVSIIASLLMLAVLPAVLLPSLARAREKANQVKCAQNLRQIGQASLLYANANIRSKTPMGPNFQALMTAGPLSSSVFVCPSDAGSGTGQLPGSSCSYIWLGANLRPSSNPECIMAYEPLSNHGGEGINVLYADGHVEFIRRAEAAQIIKDLEAGKNPPSSGGAATDVEPK